MIFHRTEINSARYWKDQDHFTIALTSERAIDFVVLDIESITPRDQCDTRNYCVVEVELARVSDFGTCVRFHRCIKYL